jgi:cell wall assembly regulator SMI1
VSGTPKQILEKFSESVILRPGLSEEEIARFQRQLSGALPREVRELLLYSAGFEVASVQLLKSRRTADTTQVLFTGNGDVALSILPCLVTLLGDGCGNFWIVDVNPSGAWGAILFVCHDPPVIAIQAADLASFLYQVLNPGGRDSEGALEYVRNTATSRIWRDDPWLVSVQDARMAQDTIGSKFAERLPDNFRVTDLRSMKVGSGFSWGKAGPNADIRRNGAELVFGIEQKPAGFLRRIFGRRSSG